MTKKLETPVIHSTNNHHLRKRVTIDCTRPVLTDQSQKQSCDINNIIAQFQKTGIIPQSAQIQKYMDTTNMPSIEEAYNTVRDAQEAFMELPSQVRRRMDNDPSKLEAFIADEDNREILTKYGLFNKKPETTEKISTGGTDATQNADKHNSQSNS